MPGLPRPEGHHTLTPACIVPQAAEVIAFLEKAFGARVVERYEAPGGVIAHAEVMLGDCVVMIGEPMQGMEPMPAALSYYVVDGPAVDAAYDRALDAGAESEQAPEDRFYGYRAGTVKDIAGNRWTICAVIEQLTPEEIQRRMEGMGG